MKNMFHFCEDLANEKRFHQNWNEWSSLAKSHIAPANAINLSKWYATFTEKRSYTISKLSSCAGGAQLHDLRSKLQKGTVTKAAIDFRPWLLNDILNNPPLDFDDGCILDGKWRIERPLNKGSFGDVYIATKCDDSKTRVAVKTIKPIDYQVTSFAEEVRLLKQSWEFTKVFQFYMITSSAIDHTDPGMSWNCSTATSFIFWKDWK